MSSTALFAVCRPTSDRPSWRKIELQMTGSSRIHHFRAVREKHLGGAGGAGVAASLIASAARIRRADPRVPCRSRHGLKRLTRARRRPRCGGWPLRAVLAARQRPHASLRGDRAPARPVRVRSGLAPSRFAATVRAGSTRHRAPSTFFWLAVLIPRRASGARAFVRLLNHPRSEDGLSLLRLSARSCVPFQFRVPVCL